MRDQKLRSAKGGSRRNFREGVNRDRYSEERSSAPMFGKLVRTDGRSPMRGHCPMPPENGIEADARGLCWNDARAIFIATVMR